jgi:hypothetical protein
MNIYRQRTNMRLGLAAGGLLVSLAHSFAAIICDNPESVSLTGTKLVLSMSSTNTAGLVFQMPTLVGSPTHLGLAFSGTAQNGVDVEALPASVLIPGTRSSVALTVKPKPGYPFASKSLTVTMTNSDNPCVLLGYPSSVTITLVGFDPPRLETARLDSSRITLSWWAPVAGYTLQSVTEPGSTNWLTVTNAPMGIQGRNSFTVTNTAGAQFYRLMKP